VVSSVTLAADPPRPAEQSRLDDALISAIQTITDAPVTSIPRRAVRRNNEAYCAESKLKWQNMLRYFAVRANWTVQHPNFLTSYAH